MKRTLNTLVLLFVLPMLLIGCGRIETNNVGVRTSWDKQINPNEVGEGFYTAITSSVDEFSAKEITIELMNMTPQTGDNLNLRDLDVEVYYRAAKDIISELNMKYAKRNAYDEDKGVYYPAFFLVRSVSRNGIYEKIGNMDSLLVNKNRESLAEQIKSHVQAKLDETDPDAFTITNVIIRNVQVDPSIQDSIKIAVAKDKELEAMQKQEEIAKAVARANNALNQSLTPNILRSRELDIQELAIKEGANLLVTIGGNNAHANPYVEVGQFMKQKQKTTSRNTQR